METDDAPVPKINPAPRRPREVFELFSLYDPAGGIQSLLDKVDFTGTHPADIFRCVHQRRPKLIQFVVEGKNYKPKHDFAAALASGEFQSSVLHHLLDSFPEKRRVIFIHIPKSAGTDLIQHLAHRYLSINNRIEINAWTSTDLFLRR